MHLGLYAFTKKFLEEFTKLPQTPLEKIESLEQLRALENGIPIYVSQTPHRIIEINYPADIDAARLFVENGGFK
jgi:3-deoxy-manno-octulosonate cytidylyltransferase (CMP-KDO synthetase)